MQISVRVIPRSSQNKLTKLSENYFRAHLRAAPVDGRANDALIKILSDYFSVSKSRVEILRGQTSKNKIVKIFDSLT